MAMNTPSAYKPEYCELVVELLKDGGSLAVFRAHVGISKSTMHYWRKTYPEFEHACQLALDAAQLWWETIAKSAVTGTGAPKGASPVILAGLYNRGHREEWSNKQEVEQTVKTETQIDLSKLTDEELKAYELLLAAQERIASGDQPA
ncbi:terminase small subunit protein [Rhizobium phage RHph_X3_2]|nr:terminase small subunit protein [Rhizobium phage RHph_X3_2]